MLLLALVASWQFSASARAQTAMISPGIFTTGSIDGIECITADDANEEPLQICDDSSDLPNDPDGSGAVMWADKASIPSRSDQGPPEFPATSFNIAVQCSLGTAPILLLQTHTFYSLLEHIRERAPPVAPACHVVALAKMEASA